MLQAHFARVSTHEGAFSSSLNLPWELAPEDEVYPWNRWYTRRSFAPGACPWSMLREQNPSALRVAIRSIIQWIKRLVFLMLIHWIAVYLVANLGGIPSWKTGVRLEWGTVRVTSLALGSAVGTKEKIGDEKAKKQNKIRRAFFNLLSPYCRTWPQAREQYLSLIPTVKSVPRPIPSP